MRLIDANALERALLFSNKVFESVDEDGLYEVISVMDETPTIETKQVKYYDEDENVWKIGEVIVG